MVITNVNQVVYQGDGVTTAFPFTFTITDSSEVYLQLVHEDDTVTAITQDFYVDVPNNTVHYPGYAPGSEPPEANRPPKVQTGEKLVIYRDVPMTQEINLGDKWPFVQIEFGLDKLTMICQQIYSYTNRKLDAALASMFQLAGIVTDSDKLQHITDQLNAIDDRADDAEDSADAAATSEANALSYKNAAANSATNASNSASSASTTARALTDIYNEAIASGQIVAPAVDPTLSISGAAADSAIVGYAIKKINLIDTVLEATFYNNGTNYIIYDNANAVIVCFPVVSGQKYTFYRGYGSNYARIAYCSSKPEINSVVTGYADFSTTFDYTEFTASQTGWACVKVYDSGDAQTKTTILNTVYANVGTYNDEYTQKSTDLANVININDVNCQKMSKVLDLTSPVNIIDGYLYAQVTSGGITESTAHNKLSVVFPVRSGTRYTLDKKVATVHTRIGYTTNYPQYGDNVSNYSVLRDVSSSNCTFTAPQDGYGVLWVLDMSYDGDVTTDYIINHTIVYEGDYRPNYNTDTYHISNDVVDVPHIFYCGANRELNTLKKGIEKATQYMDSILYVDSGVYDLVSEFGQTWFDNLDATTMVGLQLKNRVHIVFSPNSKVTSHYTGNNEYAQKLYSPFNAGEYGFTLENLNLDCSRCRYGIHDERNGGTEQYKSHYINCNVYIDNSENDYWHNRHSIGGGLGTNAEVIIENCTWDNDDASTRWGVYYHTSNSQNGNKKTTVVIKDNYFVKGCVTFEDAGATSTTDKATFFVTNCSFPKKYDGTDDNGVFRLNLSGIHNNVYAWNNNFRS